MALSCSNALHYGMFEGSKSQGYHCSVLSLWSCIARVDANVCLPYFVVDREFAHSILVSTARIPLGRRTSLRKPK